MRCCFQADVTWSPSSLCGLATPPPERAGAGPLQLAPRTTSISGETQTSCPVCPQ